MNWFTKIFFYEHKHEYIPVPAPSKIDIDEKELERLESRLDHHYKCNDVCRARVTLAETPEQKTSAQRDLEAAYNSHERTTTKIEKAKARLVLLKAVRL